VADVTAAAVVDVVPKASGLVTEVLKQRGDTVNAGDVLFRIDDKDALSAKQKSELSLQSAEQGLQKEKDDQATNRQDLKDAVSRAQTAYDNAVQDYNKAHNDYDAGKITEHQLEQSQQQTDSAKMSLDSAVSKLAANENNDTITSYETQQQTARLALSDATRALDNYEVKAPIGGILTDFNVIVGQTISAGKIGQIQQVAPVKLKAELSESNDQLVKNKKELIYYNPDTPDVKGTAKISYLAPVMSATSKTFSLELEVPNTDQKLQPGTRVMVQLTTAQEEQVVAISTLSIIRENSDAYVFVQQGDHYEKRKVQLGRINGEYQEVTSGLKEGEQLVVSGQSTLKDGQKVDSAPAAGASAQPASSAPASKPAAKAKS
jgi:RND family efflux transporter MFP subunit